MNLQLILFYCKLVMCLIYLVLFTGAIVIYSVLIIVLPSYLSTSFVFCHNVINNLISLIIFRHNCAALPVYTRVLMKSHADWPEVQTTREAKTPSD